MNVEYCRKHNIQMFRRKSGGGCVYADLDNLMLCYIEKGDDVQLTYSCFITLMTGVLRRLGLDVKPTGRNDITIDGKKISGSAFYHIPNGRNIVHSMTRTLPTWWLQSHRLTRNSWQKVWKA